MSKQGDDDEIDDESLQSMRSVWLSMRDEEPPAAGMSALMAAAAAKATEMRETRPSWWQRAFAQLRRPPALAFATVMVLIGGAVVVTRNQDELKVEEKAPELRVQEPPLAAPVTEPPPDPAAAAPVTGAVDQEAAPAAPTKVVRPRGPATAKPRPAPDRRADRDDEAAGPNEPTRAQRFEEGADAPAFETKAGGAKSVDTAPGMVDGRATPRSRSHADDPTPPNEQLARQAERAAVRGDCAAVKTIVARLRQQDEAFYRSRLGTSAAVAKCL